VPVDAMANSDTDTHLVVFSLAGEEYGLPIARVQEIVRYSEPQPMAASPRWACGAIALRGVAVPVCDLAARAGVAGDPSKIVIVETGAGIAGVIVDEVSEVVTVTAAELSPARGRDAALAAVIAHLGERLVAVLDPNAIFGPADLEAVA
jgi:purine-binding chemotaxis protein CheW